MLIACGIDVSKNTLDVCLLINGIPIYSIYPNDDFGFSGIVQLLHSNKISLTGFESTGVYHKKLQSYLVGNGYEPFIIAPLSISYFRKSLKIQGKTDKTDSYAIAYYLLKGDNLNSLVYPIRDYFKPFTTSIVQLDKQSRQLSNLIHSLEYGKDTDSLILELTKAIAVIKDTRKVLFDHSVNLLREKCPEFDLVKNDIKGVGDTLMLFLLPFLYDHFDKFNVRQITSFFGLNPVSFQSGTSVKRRDKISKRGDKQVLKMLYMASVASVRSNPIIKEKYLKQKLAGKHPKVALMAVMSHLLRAIVSRLSHHTGRPIKK
ncbi:MAG: transposase [Sulfuricurvum sp.]|nr:transposase [Sulfuricurvum sp.]